MAALFDRGHHRQIEGVARKIGKRTHAAFAKHYVVIAFRQNVFGGHQKFVERSGHAAFQQDRLLRAARALQQ